jgi:hypothetical protein
MIMSATVVDNDKGHSKMDSKIAMKGTVVGAVAVRDLVQIWVQSPTGDITDAHLFEMRCTNADQAKFIASQWRMIWGLES